MRRLPVIVLSLFVSLVQASALYTVAAAQSPTATAVAAPGAGHGFLIDKHIAAGLTCSKCHAESPPAKGPDTATCLTCHGGTYAKLAAMTSKDDPNPHASHQGDVDCAECHHVHTASVTLCDQCHSFGMKTP